MGKVDVFEHKMVVIGQSGRVREKNWLFTGRVVVILNTLILYFVLYRNNQIYKKGQSQRLKWLGQHNNRDKVVLFGQSGCIPAEVVVIGKKWLYSGKSG